MVRTTKERVEVFDDGRPDKITTIAGPLHETRQPIDRALRVRHFEGGEMTEQLAYAFVAAGASAFNTFDVGDEEIQLDGRNINEKGGTLQMIMKHQRSLIFATRGQKVTSPTLAPPGKKEDGNQQYNLSSNGVLQSFNAWESQVSATEPPSRRSSAPTLAASPPAVYASRSES